MTIKNPAEDAATAKFSVSIPPFKVDAATQNVATVIKANPALAAHPEIQQGLAAWTASSESVDASVQKLKAAHAVVTSLIPTIGIQMAAWRRATHSIVGLVNAASAGSAQAVAAWGFETTARAVIAPTFDPPTSLRVTYSSSFAMTVRWAGVKGHIGYQLQIGDGTPTGWGASIACTKASYVPSGIAAGQKVAFRVAVQRKNGLSNWSDALIVTAR